MNWWETIKTGAYFNTGTGQELKYTKAIIRQESYLRIIAIIEDGEQGMEQLVKTWPNVQECNQFRSIKTCPQVMKRLESRYTIALNNWINVFRILTPICSDPEYTSSKKFWTKKTPNR